jgi:hypothetical protein
LKWLRKRRKIEGIFAQIRDLRLSLVLGMRSDAAKLKWVIGHILKVICKL